MATLLVFASSYGACATLALGMSRYRQQVWRRKPANALVSASSALGGFGLALAAWAAVARFGWALGLVWWAAALTVANLSIALAITYQARRVGLSAALAWLAAAAAAIALQ